jgi:catechol 2,3-dioxygenase-like lactoylglutathione lyase family enzyme
MSRLDTVIERDVASSAGTVDMKLEVVVIPVSDVGRAKRFYDSLGWRLDADFVVGDAFLVQFTPPGSPCSIHFGTGLTSAVPGSASGLYLVVSDIEAARAELVARGVDVSDVFHRAGPGKPSKVGIRRGRATSLTPPSAIQTATSGCCKRSPPGSRAGLTRTRRASPPHQIWGARCAARRLPTASTRSAPALQT